MVKKNTLERINNRLGGTEKHKSDLEDRIVESVSCSVRCDSWQPHGLEPARLLSIWNSPGKNTGVGSNSLLQGIFPT